MYILNRQYNNESFFTECNLNVCIEIVLNCDHMIHKDTYMHLNGHIYTVYTLSIMDFSIKELLRAFFH